MPSTASPAPARVGDRWTVLAMLVITSFLLGLIILLGWERLIHPFTASFAFLLATLITVLAGLVARHIGVRWSQDTIDAKAGGDRPSYRWLIPYPAFFFISALGVINVAYYHLEGPSVLKQNIQDVEADFATLLSTAAIELHDKDHEAKVEQVQQLLAKLSNEIVNPNGRGYCGVGPFARKTIAEIAALLPAFAEFSGSGSRAGHDCAQAPRLAAAYVKLANDQLQNDPDFVRADGPNRQRFLAKLKGDVTQTEDQLEGSRRALDESGIMDRESAYAVARNGMETAAVLYADDRQTFDKLTGRTHEALPMAFDLNPSRDLGSFTTILHSLFRRAGFFTTWWYIVFAVAMDFVVLTLVKSAHAAFLRGGRRATPGHESYGDVQTQVATLPRFLWVNPD